MFVKLHSTVAVDLVAYGKQFVSANVFVMLQYSMLELKQVAEQTRQSAVAPGQDRKMLHHKLPALKCGWENKAEAVLAYVASQHSSHIDLKGETCGLFIDQQHRITTDVHNVLKLWKYVTVHVYIC